MKPRPRIGITTSLNDGEQRLDRRYVLAVEHAGGLPVIVPMLDTDAATDAFAALLDGLVVTGGPAITDGLVGSLPDEIQETAEARLASDKRTLSAFLAARRPALGICYGMQLGNALAGGTIYADVEAQRAGTTVHSQKRGGTDHPVAFEPGSHLRRVLQKEAAVVNTRHLQAIEEPGRGLRVAARSPDGVIEAVESDDGLFLGVQWHPERMDGAMTALFRHLVEQARAARPTAR
jgi:putative glutamine amidotransferase